MTTLRQTIARRLKDAQSAAAMLTTVNTVDMKALMDLRGHYEGVFEKKLGLKLGFMGIFPRAETHALKEIPRSMSRSTAPTSSTGTTPTPASPSIHGSCPASAERRRI